MTGPRPDADGYAFLHGFASGALSTKGTFLRERLAARGVSMWTPDLNAPTFGAMTYTSMLAEIDRLDDRVRPARWNLVGSSMGGYLAARWAELRPDRVGRLLLLCPGFDLPSRWPALLGEQEFRAWERRGWTPVDDALGRQQELAWSFLEDSRRHPAWPRAVRPTRILHGSRDDVVPTEGSRRWAAAHADVELIELDDDHRLMRSLATILANVEAWFGLRGPDGPGSGQLGQP